MNHEKPYIIVDHDNWISDDQWRLSKIDYDRLLSARDDEKQDCFREYHEAAWSDEFKNNFIIEYALKFEYELIICTNRPEEFKDMTVDWLKKYRIPYSSIFMRPSDDIQAAADLKESLIERIVPLCFRAYDDHLDVIERYKKMGIRAVHCFINDRTTKKKE